MIRTPVLAVSGEPGAGKTTTARAVARRMGAALLDLDQLDPLVDIVAGPVGGYGDPAVRALREARYACLVRTAVDCVDVGRPVVLSAPFTQEREDDRAWSAFVRPLRAAGADVWMVWVDVPPRVRCERLVARAAPRDRGQIAGPVTERVADPPPKVPHLRVDVLLPPACQADLVVAAIPGRIGSFKG